MTKGKKQRTGLDRRVAFYLAARTLEEARAWNSGRGLPIDPPSKFSEFGFPVSHVSGYADLPGSSKAAYLLHLAQLRRDVEAGQIDTVVFVNAHRLRIRLGELLDLCEFLLQHGVVYVFLRERDNPKSKTGKTVTRYLIVRGARTSTPLPLPDIIGEPRQMEDRLHTGQGI
jgi:hypothetical protein